MPKIKAVLFDLDGTLLDTARDLGRALNEVRREHGLAALSYETVRPHVSHGANRMVQLGFPQASGEQFDTLRQRLLDVYAQALAVETCLFPGLADVLETLEVRRMHWGIVTNKPGFLTEPLLMQLQLHSRCACVVSGDTLAERKPHPAPMLHAARLINTEPEACLYVGDAERDVQAGRAAGMRTLVAKFGYLAEHDRPETWQADAMIDHPSEILDWVERFS